MGNLIAGVLIGIFIASIAARIALHSTIKDLKQKGWLKWNHATNPGTNSPATKKSKRSTVS
jgi:hypothetical protein